MPVPWFYAQYGNIKLILPAGHRCHPEQYAWKYWSPFLPARFSKTFQPLFITMIEYLIWGYITSSVAQASLNSLRNKIIPKYYLMNVQPLESTHQPLACCTRSTQQRQMYQNVTTGSHGGVIITPTPYSEVTDFQSRPRDKLFSVKCFQSSPVSTEMLG
jgi:hypothetical protein